MVIRDLDAFSRSEEVKDFASSFFHAVQRGDVFSDGYALTSNQRPGHHIPTGTAPITLEGAMDIIVHKLQAEKTPATPGIIRNLEAAVQSITLAEHFLSNRQQNLMSEDSTRHVRENIGAGLPGMKKIVDALKQNAP